MFLERRFYRFDHAQRTAEGAAARAALAAAPGAGPPPPQGPGAAGPHGQGPPAGGGPQVAPIVPPVGGAGGVGLGAPGVGLGAPGAALPVPAPAGQPAAGAGNGLAGGTVPIVAPGPGHFAGMPAAGVNHQDLARQALAQDTGGQAGQEEGFMNIDVFADGGQSDPSPINLDADDEADHYPPPHDFGFDPVRPQVGGKAPAAAIPPLAGKGPQGVRSRASRKGWFMGSDFARADYYKSARGRVARQYPPDFSDGEWEPGWNIDGVQLGAGGMGVAFLYRRYEDNRLVDRVVAKDCYVDHASWSQHHKWEGDYRDPNNRSHMEIACVRIPALI